MPEIDLVMGPQYANRLGDLLEDVMNGNQVIVVLLCPQPVLVVIVGGFVVVVVSVWS